VRTNRPVLCAADFVCTCGYRARAEVLGRRGHRYDELEGANDPDEPVRESYAAEGRGVLDLFRCPKCNARPGIARELKRVALWAIVLLVMTAFVSLILWATHEELAAKAALVAVAIAIVARLYAFVAAIFEARDRVRLVS